MTKPTAIVSHPACALHDTGWSHPEHQGRLPAIVKGIYRQTPDLLDLMLQAEAPSASEEDIRRVHTSRHVERIREAAAGADAAGEPQRLTPDTVVSGASWEAALGAAGAAIHGVRLVLAEEARTAFALTRPPGHHATADRAMGFCLFNNAAVAARWTQTEGGLERVMVVDWDVHHGNGTQDLFYDDGTVHYLSFHLTGHYPGTGGVGETGEGAGSGATRNVPFRHGTGRSDYLERFEEATREIVGEFRPELILVSAGFDCLGGDPLGGLRLEPEDLHTMTRWVMEAAEAGAGGRVVALLEGGYVPARVAEGVVQVIRAFAGLPPTPASSD
jgi:acetoin utilization deacetylase AcuC-like enzyme